MDETFSVTTDQPPTGAGEYAYVIARRTAANTEYRLKVRLKADGSVLVQATKAVANLETPLGVETLVPGVTFAAGTPLHIHAQLIGASPTTIRMRAWTGATEPTSWPYVMTDATAELQAAGGVGLRAYLPTNAGAPVTFSFDDLLVTDASVPPPPPPPPPPPDQIAADAFTRTVAGGWGTADTGGAYTVSAANAFAVTGSAGTMRAQPGQTRVATLAVSARDVDETFSVTTDQAATGTGLYAYAVARRIDASTEYRAFIRFAANGSIHVAAAAVTGGTEHVIGSPGQIAPAGTYAAGARYHVRLQVTGASPTTIRMRAWLDGTTEPTSWVYSVTDSTAALQVAGAISLRAYVSSTATSGAVTFSFDDLQVVATD